MSWLDSFFQTGYKTIQIAGIAIAAESTINFVSGASGVDNPGLTRSDITIFGSGLSGSTIHRGASGMGDANFTVVETGGTDYIGCNAVFTAARSLILPASPGSGQIVMWADENTSVGGAIASFNLVINGNGNQVQGPNGTGGVAQGATYNVTDAIWGGGSLIQVLFNGSFWKVS